jgi:hypothetical protein
MHERYKDTKKKEVEKAILRYNENTLKYTQKEMKNLQVSESSQLQG